MSYLSVPGHERDAMADLDRAAVTANALRDLGYTLADPVLPDESIDLDSIEFGMTGAQLLGLDDARLVLDEMAYDEWAAAQDEYEPTVADLAVARMAALG